VRILATLVLALGLVACAKKSPPAQEPVMVEQDPASAEDEAPPAAEVSDADIDALMNETIAFITALTESSEAVAGDCGQIATAIATQIDSHQDLITRARVYDNDESVQTRADAWMEAHQAEIDPIYQRMGAVIGPCADDPRVAEQFERMDGAK
jgi:hypothetical protein